MTYNNYDGEEGNARKGEKKTLEVDVVIGADGANSRVAKDIEAGDYEYAIAFQERMRIPEQKMDYYKDRAEMYVGDWRFPPILSLWFVRHFNSSFLWQNIFCGMRKNDEPHFNNLIY
jgi:flavin-dependent dehydrogenase